MSLLRTFTLTRFSNRFPKGSACCEPTSSCDVQSSSTFSRERHHIISRHTGPSCLPTLPSRSQEIVSRQSGGANSRRQAPKPARPKTPHPKTSPNVSTNRIAGQRPVGLRPECTRLEPTLHRDIKPHLRRTLSDETPARGAVESAENDYLSSTSAPTSSSCALTFSASSFGSPSLTGFGAPSTRSFASLRPRLVMARTSLMT